MKSKNKIKNIEPVNTCPFCGRNTVKLIFRRNLSADKDIGYIDRLQCGACRRVFLDRHVYLKNGGDK